MAVQRAQPSVGEQHRELPVEELLRRAQPLPSHEEMAIADLTAEEAEVRARFRLLT
jgi:hypothetical protein